MKKKKKKIKEGLRFFPIWQSFMSCNANATYSGFLEHWSDFLHRYKFYNSVLEIFLAIFL